MILDPNDCVLLSSITVLAYPHPSGDSCKTRTFLAYMQRVDAPAWQVLVCEDLGTSLGPPLGAFPGPKEGSATLEGVEGALIVRYTGRVPGDLNGPFQLQKEIIPVANIWPIDLVACLRVRNVARILSAHFPDLKEDLAAYVK